MPDQPMSDQPLPWRTQPGLLRPGLSNNESIHTLLGDFLRDRHGRHLVQGSAALLPEGAINAGWGQSPPLEKVIRSNADLERLLEQPWLYRQAICILEPANHVGENARGEGVRASLNVACLAQGIADCDSILFPLWEAEPLDPERLLAVLSGSLAVVVEGGHPSVKDPDSFHGCRMGHDALLQLCEQLLLSRANRSAPGVFICLGHQLVAQAHVRLIQRATACLLEQASMILESTPHLLDGLVQACETIVKVGENLEVVKNGRLVARGWHHPHFAVALNETAEVGHCELLHYDHPGPHPSPHFSELLVTHNLTSEIHNGIIEHSITYEKDLNIVMFHSDEVNEEAVLFANWAYRTLHNRIAPARKPLAVSPLSWLLSLPSAVEILCSTISQGAICTEVAATCINYTDFETQRVRRSFSCQFHPELLSELRTFDCSGMPSYSTLKRDDGVRLLMRILHEAVHD
jgi:GMP synthase-like glutamine amidotransferase